MDDRKIIARNICAERNRAGMTQQQVADTLGIERSTYTRLESGFVKIDSTYIYKLANIFGCKTDDFYMGLITTKRVE